MNANVNAAIFNAITLNIYTPMYFNNVGCLTSVINNAFNSSKFFQKTIIKIQDLCNVYSKIFEFDDIVKFEKYEKKYCISRSINFSIRHHLSKNKVQSYMEKI